MLVSPGCLVGPTTDYSTDVLLSQWFDFDRVILLVFAVLMVALLIASELHYAYGGW